MSSKPRKQSVSGFYHVCQRGINKFDIFEDDADRAFFTDRMCRYAKEYGIEIHSWVLMSDHFHLLLRSGFKELSAMMRTLGSVYARYFNRRHERSGPLYEGRFYSVCVETEPQLLSTVRYIHRNPVHHEKTALYGNFRWSSYREYVNASPTTCKLEFVLNLFGSVTELVRFHREPHDSERHPDIGTMGPMRDDEARWRANKALDVAGYRIEVSHIGTLPRDLRNKAIVHVKRSVRCSLRQIQRLTSIAYCAIRRAVESMSLEPNAKQVRCSGGILAPYTSVTIEGAEKSD